MRGVANFVFTLTAVFLTSCATTPGGDTLLDAMGRGAIAGLTEGLTGVEQPNPYLTGNAETQQQQQENASVKPDPKYLVAHYGKHHAALIEQGNIDIGMNGDEVRFAWGDPSGRDAKGKSKEVWNYGEDKVVFTRGKVSAVTH
jgi:hypothetical protein